MKFCPKTFRFLESFVRKEQSDIFSTEVCINVIVSSSPFTAKRRCKICQEMKEITLLLLHEYYDLSLADKVEKI